MALLWGHFLVLGILKGQRILFGVINKHACGWSNEGQMLDDWRVLFV